MGAGVGITIGSIAGYLFVQGAASFLEAIRFFRGIPESRLLVKYHDALAAAVERDNQFLLHKFFPDNHFRSGENSVGGEFR